VIALVPDLEQVPPAWTIAIIATGGTIANTPTERVGVDQVLADIFAGVGASHRENLPPLEIHDILRAGAETFGPPEWMMIAKAVADAVASPHVSGVVVTHGSVTAEETAYFLNLVVPTEKPIVVTCAQRRHGSLSNDGDKNLIDSIRVAASPAIRGIGAVLVINEEIHAARDVAKASQRPSGFHSRWLGPLGSVDGDQVTIYRRPVRRHTATSEFRINDIVHLPRVDVLATYAGADGVAVDAFLASGTAGLVVIGFAFNGKPYHAQMPALTGAAERGIPVVLTSRGGGGRTPRDGSHPFITGDDLSATKARILLMVGLTRASEGNWLQHIFDEY
jgi:L-asparaginase